MTRRPKIIVEKHPGEATIRRRASPWLFFVGAFTLSWLFWVPAAVLSQRGSEPPDLFFHFAYNSTFSFVYPIPTTVHVYGTILTLILALAITVVWGPQTLARRRFRRHRKPAVA